ncbi:GSCOCG00003659001-RA-CDS [Cotesia congregata]|nr:GSCOCG00003659001-RA-CDS [Cotesia congregata]
MIIMPPTIPPDSAMCSLCPRPKKPQKKLVRFDSVVDTFSISDSSGPRRSHDSWQGHDGDQDVIAWSDLKRSRH